MPAPPTPLRVQKRTKTAIRQCNFILVASDRDRLLAGALHQLQAHAIFQLVDHVGIFEIGDRVLVMPAFQRNDLQSLLRQFHGQNSSGPAEADDDHVFFFS